MVVSKFNELRVQRVLQGIKKRNMNGYYCKDTDHLIETVSLLMEGAKTVGTGGSQTLLQSGILDLLRNRSDIELFDRNNPNMAHDEKDDMCRQALLSDVYIMSTNAITEDGILVNIDGTGNRVASLIFGPKKVIVVAGINKVVSTLDEAIMRARTIAAPMNTMRLDMNTPCKVTGVCANCQSPECICAQVVVTRRSFDPDRIHIILTDKEYGF